MVATLTKKKTKKLTVKTVDFSKTMRKVIDIKFLRDKSACSPGISLFINLWGVNGTPEIEEALQTFVDKDHADYAHWIMIVLTGENEKFQNYAYLTERSRKPGTGLLSSAVLFIGDHCLSFYGLRTTRIFNNQLETVKLFSKDIKAIVGGNWTVKNNVENW